jgi:glycosyltransferase involved in cell wall biosynthesis
MTADTTGGIWQYCVDLCRHLIAHEVHVALATMGAPVSAEQRADVRRLSRVDLFESHYALEWMDDPWADVEAAGEWLIELERQVGPDVVHLNGYCHAACPFSAPVVIVAHSCVSSWWRATLGEDAPERYHEYRRRVKRGIRAATALVAPTWSMLDALVAQYGRHADARVIHNGVDAKRFWVGHKGEYFLAAGRLSDEAKNLTLLVDAAKELPWPVRIAGQPANGDRARPGVELLGHVQRAALATLMAGAPVFVHPALYEPFGLAPMEAALSGCALLLSDIDTLREVWDGAALYVPANDRSALIDVASELASDGRWRDEWAARARKRAALFPMDATARAYQALYAELLMTCSGGQTDDAHAAAGGVTR